MSCIVAIKSDGIVYMGADSAGSDGYNTRSRKDPKIHKVGPFMFGFTTSFRMGQLLAHSFSTPDRDPRVSVEKFMSTIFIDAVRNCLKTGGWAASQSGTEVGGNFLVAYEGRIFQIESDYQVGESFLAYESVGCGENIAMGSLHTTETLGLEPSKRLELALQAASEFSCGVGGPFIYANTKQ